MRVLVVALLSLAACSSTSSQVKDASAGGTIACQSNTNCPANLPMCHPESHVCVGCIESFQTCDPGYTCQASTHTCVPLDPNAPCKRNVDCPRQNDHFLATSCEVDAGTCVNCVVDTDCVSPDRCINHTCQVPDGG